MRTMIGSSRSAVKPTTYFGVTAAWALNPLLILGGAYLCFEGFEKILELLGGHAHAAHDEHAPVDAAALEEQRVASALRTDRR